MLKIAIILCAVLFVAAEDYPWSNKVKIAQDEAKAQINALILELERKLNLTLLNQAAEKAAGRRLKADNMDENEISDSTPNYIDSPYNICNAILEKVKNFRDQVDACGKNIPTNNSATEAIFCAKSAAGLATYFASRVP